MAQRLTREASIEAFAGLFSELEAIRVSKHSKADTFIEARDRLTAVIDRGALMIPAVPIEVDLAAMWRYEDKGILPSDGGAPIFAFTRRLFHFHSVAKRIVDILRDDVLWRIHASGSAPPPTNQPAPVAELITTNPSDRQYAVLLELMQPVVRLLEWSKRYITLLGDDAGVKSRIARSSHLDHFRTAGAELRAGWARYEPAIFEERVRDAFFAQQVTALTERLGKLTDADRDAWDGTIRAIQEQAQILDGAMRAVIAEYQRAQVPAANQSEHEFMAAAIEEARKSLNEPNKTPLFVGAVVVKDGKIIARGHRGQHKLGEHAEYTTLERNLEAPGAAANATLYCTLEPCIVRNHPKSPCADWIKRHRISRVVIGVIDPNRRIRGGGVKQLRQAGIDVALFPGRFANEIEALNSAFEREHEKPPIEEPSPPPRGFHQPNTVPEIFYEWRRWENPTGKLDETEGVFDKAWIETDQANERAMWDVCVVNTTEVAAFFDRAAQLAARMAILRNDLRVMRYNVVVAVVGDAPGDAERGAKALLAQVWPSRLGVSLLVGWIAKHHFVAEAMTLAA